MNYFISYTYIKDVSDSSSYYKTIKSGFGNDTVHVGKEVECLEDIQDIEKIIKNRYQYDSVVIINYRTL